MLTDKEKEIIDNCKVQDIINYLDVDDVLDNISLSDISEHYDLDDILDEYSYPSDIADYLDNKGFDFSDYVDGDENEDDNDDIDNYSEERLLVEFCHRLHPNRILTKEDIREITNDYIDYMINKCY